MDKDPNPLATGPTKWRADHCVTHHHGCDCREWEHANRVAELEQDAEMFRWLATYPNLYTVADLLRKDQYATLRRACESLMPLEGANAEVSGAGTASAGLTG